MEPFKMKTGIAFMIAIYSILIVSCNKNNTYDEKTVANIFDFSTRKECTLSFKYNVPDGYKVYFEVYAENPLVADFNKGEITKNTNLEPIDKGYTDDKGSYNKPIVFPSYVKELYIYSPNSGVTRLMACSIENGTLSEVKEVTFTAPAQKSANSVNSGTKAVRDNYFYYPKMVKTNTLGNWESSESNYIEFPNKNLYVPYGRPYYLSNIFGQTGDKAPVNVPAEIWKSINAALPGDGHNMPNMDVLKSGDLKIHERAELKLFILDSKCLYNNTLAYYCYPTANPPATVSDIKIQTIAFPCARTGIQTTGGVVANSLLVGEGIKLKYCDANGNMSDEFPAGTSIGWILYSDGYNIYGNFLGGFPYESGVVTEGKGAIYSNKDFNNGINHTALFRHNDFVVTTFEDVKKTSENEQRDYLDILFNVVATPSSAITPELPDIKPEEPKEIKSSYYGILAFEDLWPYQGDFDMNDVVIKYVSNVTFNSKNEVTETENIYTILWSGAEMNNSFSYQDPNMKNGATVTFEGENKGSVDMTNNIVRVASNIRDYANNSTKKSFIVKTKYSTPIAKENFIYPPYNPFITANGVEQNEIHLTNNKPTNVANFNFLGTGHDKSKPLVGQYYITFDNNNQQMPFAIDIVFTSEKEIDKFTITEERERVDARYPEFIKWVTSGGKNNGDWYLHPLK